jgi:hypothetical protein
MIFFPGSAPNLVLDFLVSFSSILYWVLREVVCADMLMTICETAPFSFMSASYLAIMAVLPIPEEPVKNSAFSIAVRWSSE